MTVIKLMANMLSQTYFFFLDTGEKGKIGWHLLHWYHPESHGVEAWIHRNDDICC